jgi:hypothetical protein
MSNFEVHGTTNNVEWSVSGVNSDESNAVGALNKSNLVYTSNNDVFEAFAYALNPLNHETEVIHDET